MNKSGNDFLYGRDIVKKLLIGAAAACVVSLFAGQGTTLQFALIALTVVLFIFTIVCVVKFCRCPHCDKVIFLGVLAVQQCPRCKRSLVTGKKMKKSK